MTFGAIDQIRPVPPSSAPPKGGEAAGKPGATFADAYNDSSSTEETDILAPPEPAAALNAKEHTEDGDKNADHGDDPSGGKHSDGPWPKDGETKAGPDKEISVPTLAQAWLSAPPAAASESPEAETSAEPMLEEGQSTDLPVGIRRGANGKTDVSPVQKPDEAMQVATEPLADPVKHGETTAAGSGSAGQERPGDRREGAHQVSALKISTSAPSQPPENPVPLVAAPALSKPKAVSDPSEGQASRQKRADGSGPQVQTTSSSPPSTHAISAPSNPMPVSGAALLLWGKLSPTQSVGIDEGAATTGLSSNAVNPTTGSTAAQQPTASIPYQAIPAKLAEMSRSGQTGPVELSLAPEELGRVRMQILLDGDAVRIVLQAERAETAELLRRNGDALLSEFRQSGFDDASFSFTGWGAGGQSDRQERFAVERRDPNAAAPIVEAFQKPIAATAYTLSLGLNLRL